MDSSPPTSGPRRRLSELTTKLPARVATGLSRVVGKVERRVSTLRERAGTALSKIRSDQEPDSPPNIPDEVLLADFTDEVDNAILKAWYITHDIKRIKQGLRQDNDIHRSKKYIFARLYCWINPETNILEVYSKYQKSKIEELQRVLEEAWKNTYDYFYFEEELGPTRYYNPQDDRVRTDWQEIAALAGQATWEAKGPEPYPKESFYRAHYLAQQSGLVSVPGSASDFILNPEKLDKAQKKRTLKFW